MKSEKEVNDNRKILIIVLVILAFAVILFAVFTPSHAILSKDVLSSNSIEIKVGSDTSSSTNTVSYKSLNDTILSLATANDTSLAYDGTADNNIRYIGQNPNNYITFNSEVWRIVGVFNNVLNGTNKETRVKIVRSIPIDNVTFNTNGTNDFAASSLATYLNNEYLTTLSLDSQNYIDNATWNIAGKDLTEPNTALSFYTASNVYTGYNTTFDGKVALLSVSDYGYSTKGGDTTNKDSCLSSSMLSWDTLSDCYSNSYLYNKDLNSLTLTPRSNTNTSLYEINTLGNIASVDITDTSSKYSVYPAVYLKSDVLVKGGTGEETNPYVLK